MEKGYAIRLFYVLFIISALFILVTPFLIPILLAVTISFTLQPGLEFLMNKGLSRRFSAFTLTMLFTFIISIPLFFFVIKGSLAVTSKLEQLSSTNTFHTHAVKDIFSGIRHDFLKLIQEMLKEFKIDFITDKKIESYVSSIYIYFLDFFRNVLTGLPKVFLFLVVMILCVYSFLNRSQQIKIVFQNLTGLSEVKMNKVVNAFIVDSRQVYFTNLATGTIQSLVIAGSVSILRVGEFFLVFFITLILSFIPIIGAAPTAFIFAILSFIRHQSTVAIILLIVGIFTGIIDNILRPWLASLGESRTPPIISFVCVLGGALWLGFPGLFIGLLLGSIAYDTLPIFWREISKK